MTKSYYNSSNTVLFDEFKLLIAILAIITD